MHSINKPRFSAVLSGLSVLVYYMGKQLTFTHPSEEEAVEFFQKINESYKEERYEELSDFLDPSRKIEVTDELVRGISGQLFLKGTDIPIPLELKSRMLKFIELGVSLKPLINFWKQLLINPDEHVRRSLFQFAERFSFPITDTGYFIAYKSVAWKGTSFIRYAELISSKFIYLVSNGKNPANYTVTKVNEDEDSGFSVLDPAGVTEQIDSLTEFFKKENREKILESLFPDYPTFYAFSRMGKPLTEENVIDFLSSYVDSQSLAIDWKKLALEHNKYTVLGKLDQLYAELPKKFEFDEPMFTDFYSGTQTIKLGEAVKMDRNLCDNNPSNTCSSGLHVGAPGYVQDFGGSDRYVLACLVSPTNVVAIPNDYHFEKMRTCEYYPFAICEIGENGIEEVNSPYFEFDYLGHEQAIIEAQIEALKAKNMTEEEKAELEVKTQRLYQINTLIA